MEDNDLGDELGNKFGEFGDKMKDLKNAGIFSISLLGAEIYRIYQLILCDFTSCQESYKTPGVAEMRQSSLNVYGIRRISLETCSFCELVSCEELSAIVRAIAVIVSNLLSVCTANLWQCFLSLCLNTLNWFEEHDVEFTLLLWLAQSLDLNSIQHLWNELKTTTSNYRLLSNLNELKAVVMPA
ncbi:hypothetical protein AVEN_44244-1 [Araneus ventricosus]|uniref:Uncharacterized protein n=1 Tax=Araneus ventricosus TaxID=182803 RepID=A0A4Y2SY62_ARAVE|nr:hypothetical protein AVEN_44244-1 [Araneus ventricosus]